MSKPDKNRSIVVIAAALGILTLATFCRVLGNGFVNYDDYTYVTENTHVISGLSLRNLIWAFNIGYASNWHPLTWFSHMLDCTLFATNPIGHHATNLLIHTASVILLFLLLTRMTKSPAKSAFVAALFAVHPLHVESVAWVAERKDVLAGLFWILTTGAYVLYVERPSARRYASVVILFVLGLMSKPMLVTLPITLLLLDYWPLGRFQQAKTKKKRAWVGWKLILEKIPLLVLSAGSGVLTMLAQQKGEAVSSLALLPWAVRVPNAVVSYAMYIAKMFWPSRLTVFYPHPLMGLPVWQIAAAASALVVISVFVFAMRKRAPYLLFGWLWYVVTLVPVIGLIQVGSQSWADRYTYIPLIGLFIAISWGASRRMGDSPSRPFPHSPILPIAVIIVLAVCSCIQTGYWKDSITLFERALAVTEDNYTAYMNLGSAHASAHEYEEALGYYEDALELRDDLPHLHFDYANSLTALGRLDEAEQEYSQALSIDPEFKEARYNLEALAAKRENARLAQALLAKGGGDNADTHMNRAVALNAAGKTKEAIEEYKKAIRLKPDFPEAHSNLGVAYKELGDFDSAIREYRAAIRIRPDFQQAHANLAIAYYFVRKYADAWKEVYACRNLGVEPSADLVNALSEKMPDPGP